MSHGRVLVVDDEDDIVELVSTYLEREGYEVFVARDGHCALESLDRVAPEVVVLDVMLPRLDGLEVCREIRRTRTVPILMLSARGDDIDKILGLEVGADDYLTKPFNPKELVARVRAMFRRLRMPMTAADEDLIARGSLRIQVRAQSVEVEGRAVRLTPIEFNLLRVLAAQAGQVLSRQHLLDRVWGPDFYGDERTVDVHIRHLRAKLQEVTPGRQFVSAVWGVGYRFEA